MRLAVVGGRLQGTEAVYLANAAGFESVLVDRHPEPPASGLAGETHVIDLVKEPDRARRLLASCDAVLPACEDRVTLGWLDARLREWGVPFLFDLAAYDVSSSKLRSDALFARMAIPRPRPWPGCGLPAVVKPSGRSGSEGVRVVGSDRELASMRRALEAQGHEVVVQEFVDGPSLSLEVIRYRGETRCLLPTGLEFDEGYDCCRVFAPADAPAAVLAALAEEGRRVAEGIGLQGLMDLEVMVRDGEPKLIEIDARLPSQTPSAVLHASGVNLVDVLVRTFLTGEVPSIDAIGRRAAVYEHVRVAAGSVSVCGEHLMAHARPLREVAGFFGADVALTDRGDGEEWVATLICCAPDLPAARRKAACVEAAIAAAVGAGSRVGKTA